jgi:hypothetical protein
MKRPSRLIPLALLAAAILGHFANDQLETVGVVCLVLWILGCLFHWVVKEGKRQSREDQQFRRAFRKWELLQQLQAGVCPICRYSLIGNRSGACPECGTRFLDLLQ